MKKQFTFGALLSYGAILFNIISGLLYTPWMIRTIGDDQYALYTLSLSIINIFLIDFGIGASVTKFLSNYYAQGKYEDADRFMGIVYKVYILISCVIAICLGSFYFMIDSVYLKLTPSELNVFKNLYIIVASYSVLSFPFTTFNGILMANERFIEIKACNFGQKVFNVLLTIVFLFCGRGVYALVLVHAVSNVVFVVLKYYYIRRKTKQRVNIRRWDSDTAKKLFRFSAWLTVMSIARRGIFQIMPTLIAAMVGSTAITVFSLASTLEGYVYTFADAVNGMFMPKISRILTEENAGQKLSNLMSKVGRFHIYTIGLLYIGFICIGEQFIELWMGTGYERVYICAVLLIFPSLIDSPQQIAKTSLMVTDVVKEQGLIYSAMALINMLLALILLPKVGVVGAAASICIAYLVRTVAFNVLYNKCLPIDLVCYFKETYLRWLIVAGLVLVFGFVVKDFPIHGWFGLSVKTLLIGGFYVVLCFCIGLKKEERRAIAKRVRGGRN